MMPTFWNFAGASFANFDARFGAARFAALRGSLFDRAICFSPKEN
jgi:hypothetical protein